jgi:hypothetical protein
MTRTGKIARLPASIRDQLNCRLLENEPGASVLGWLNALPEVQAILAASFASQPISLANLSQWKNGGHRDWLIRRDALALARDLDDEQALGHQDLAGPFADKLARWLSIHYASVAVRALAAEDLDPGTDTRLRRLSQLCADVTRLQREEHQAQRIDLERQRVELQLADAELRREKDLFQAESSTCRHQDLMKMFFTKEGAHAPSPDSHPAESPPASQL